MAHFVTQGLGGNVADLELLGMASAPVVTVPDAPLLLLGDGVSSTKLILLMGFGIGTPVPPPPPPATPAALASGGGGAGGKFKPKRSPHELSERGTRYRFASETVLSCPVVKQYSRLFGTPRPMRHKHLGQTNLDPLLVSNLSQCFMMRSSYRGGDSSPLNAPVVYSASRFAAVTAKHVSKGKTSIARNRKRSMLAIVDPDLAELDDLMGVS